MRIYKLSKKTVFKILTVACLFLTFFLLSPESIQLKAFAEENPIILKEADAWKLQGEEEVTITYFPCQLATGHCEKLKIESGFYQAYFPDGFVLTLSSTGKILKHYYCVSENNRIAFEKNLETYSIYKTEPDNEKIKLRIEDMRAYLRAEEMWNERCGHSEINSLFSKVFYNLYNGRYSDVVESITKIIEAEIVMERKTEREITMGERVRYRKSATAFAVLSLAYKELGKTEKFIEYAQKAYFTDSQNRWARIAMGIFLIENGNYSDALQILHPVSDRPFGLTLIAIAHTKLGDLEKSIQIYTELPEDFLSTNSSFFRGYIVQLQASLKPYKETKFNIAKGYEAKGQYKEAIKEYADYLKLADDKEAKEIRARIAELMIKYPHLFALSEEARKAVIRAEAYTAEGKFEKAIEEYKNALKLSPFFPAIYKAIALNYAQLKEYQKAIKNMNIYLELYPDAPDTRAAKDEIYRWEFLIEKEKNK